MKNKGIGLSPLYSVFVFSTQQVLLPENRPLFPPFLWELGPRTYNSF